MVIFRTSCITRSIVMHKCQIFSLSS